MLPNSYTLPSILLASADRSVVDLKNQYSLVNRLKSRDILENFSMELQNKLPKINRRLKTMEDKENDLKIKQNNLNFGYHYFNYLQKQVNDMKKYILDKQKANSQISSCLCSTNILKIDSHCQYYMPINYNQPAKHQCPSHQCSKSNSNNESSKNSKKSSKKQVSDKIIPKNTNKKNRRNLLKKLRKYAYAVYFCIYLKYYSVRFTRNRYRFFKDRYLKNDGKKVKDDSYRITKSIESIDLIRLITNIPQSITNISDLQIPSKMTSRLSSKIQSINSSGRSLQNDEDIIPKKQEDRFKKALNFINVYLKQLQKTILHQKFIQYYSQIIGIGTLNQSFFMDDLLIPQQMQFITFSQKKGFAQIKPQTQKVLIMIYIFIKHSLFKVLLKLRQKKYLDKKLNQHYKKYEVYKDQIYDFLEMSSAILYSLVNNIFLEYLDQFGANTNYQKLKKKFKISPAKILTAPDCPRRLKQKLNLNELIIGIKKNEKIQSYLENSKYENYLGYLVGQIQTLSQNIYFKVKSLNNLIYKHLKEETLAESYVIFQGMKSQQNQKIKSMKSVKQLKFLQAEQSVVSDQLGSRLSDTSLGNMQALLRQSKNNKK